MIYHITADVDEPTLQELANYLNQNYVGTQITRFDEQDNPHDTVFLGAEAIEGGIRLDTAPENSVE